MAIKADDGYSTTGRAVKAARHIAVVAALLAASAFAAQAAEVGEPVLGKPLPPEDRIQVQPILDVPLRDPSICKGPDGTYYLTGTLSFKDEGKDFDNNAGIRLWRSNNLAKWEDMGLVYKPNRDRTGGDKWVRAPVGIMDRPDTLRHNAAITAPEIHYLKGTFWLCFSRNGYGTGLLKSETGKPEGPYGAAGSSTMITNWGSDPSLFRDDDGNVYWLWGGDGIHIARMKDDLSALAENPRALYCKSLTWTYKANRELDDDLVGRGGPFLFKVNGKYHLTASDIVARHCIMVSDVFVATATESVYGPYSRRSQMIPHSGQTTVFQDAGGRWQATYCGLDRFGVFRDKAGLVPLEWMDGYKTFYLQYTLTQAGIEGAPLMTRNKFRVITERGPWRKIRPLIEPTFNEHGELKWMVWDSNMIQAPDGYFYFTGSQAGYEANKKLRVWRSRDLRNWEDVVVRAHQDEKAFSRARRDFVAPKGNLGNCYMDCKITWLTHQKTFAVTYTCYSTNLPQFSKDKGEVDSCSGCLLSESGTIHGPWVWHDKAPHSAHYIELDDGRTVVGGGVNNIHVLKPGYWDEHGREGSEDSRLNRFAEKNMWLVNPPDTFGSFIEDSGTQLIRIGDKWVMLPVELFPMGFPLEAAAYNSAFMTADSLDGPWSRWRPAVRHGGHAFLFQGLDGHYYALIWHTGRLGVIWHNSPALVRLVVEMKDGELSIDIDEDWTVDDYVPVEVK